jgi:hypothetical protein
MYTDAYADAIRPEQLEQAIAAAVVLKYNQPHVALEECVMSAVQQVFCPCVSRELADGVAELAPLRGGLVDAIIGHIRHTLCAVQEGGRGAEVLSSTVLSDKISATAGGYGPGAEKSQRELDDALDDALAQTFPASDPVADLIQPQNAEMYRSRESRRHPAQK